MAVKSRTPDDPFHPDDSYRMVLERLTELEGRNLTHVSAGGLSTEAWSTQEDSETVTVRH